jgi:hypothetical protein
VLRDRRCSAEALPWCSQGWGNILNLAVLLFFLAVQGQTGPDYSFTALSVTWRMQYALGLLPIMYMLTYRIFYLKESSVWQVRKHASCKPISYTAPPVCHCSGKQQWEAFWQPWQTTRMV